MKRFALFVGILLCGFGTIFAADFSEHPGLIAAITRYYDTVDKAKLSYENELRKVLTNTQKAGNVKAYNAIEAELNHTIGKNGHSLTDFTPPQRSTLYSKKTGLKRAVDAARREFKAYTEKLAAELLKDGYIDAARNVDLIAGAVEPPRFYIERNNGRIVVPHLKFDLPVTDIFSDGWLDRIPRAKETSTLRKREKPCYYADWSSDGNKIVTTGDDSYAVLWDVETGREIAELDRDLHSRGNGICFTPDGKLVLFSGHLGEAGLWNPQTNKVIWKEKKSNETRNLAASPDGKIALACGDNGLFVRELITGRLLHVLTEHSVNVNNAVFLNDGKRVITTSDDATVIVWDTKDWKPIQRMQAQDEGIRGLAVSPNGRYFATGSYDDTVVIWDAASGKAIKKLGMFGEAVVSLAFSPDGSKLAVGRGNGLSDVFVLETNNWKPSSFVSGYGVWNCRMAWSPDGKRLVICCDDGPKVFEIP